ncbi:hypothetical protein [Streptomyces sp. NBC_00996]|uniref:hypothetical protein n=1 Tax=Streptomyces sp. NBC_00996 TaxID=2903710 RepID=UPI0038680EE2|nr:hypothetical protein OG390_01155 [Streptomyces sp. NBC_00996]
MKAPATALAEVTGRRDPPVPGPSGPPDPPFARPVTHHAQGPAAAYACGRPCRPFAGSRTTPATSSSPELSQRDAVAPPGPYSKCGPHQQARSRAARVHNRR